MDEDRRLLSLLPETQTGCPYTKVLSGNKFVCLKPIHDEASGHVMCAEEDL